MKNLRSQFRKMVLPLCLAALPLSLYSFKPIDQHEKMMIAQTYTVNTELVNDLVYVNNSGMGYETDAEIAALPCAVARVATKVWQKSCKEAARGLAYWLVDELLGGYAAYEVQEMEAIGIIERL